MLKNCKVIGEGISYEVYSRQAPGIKRGDAPFIMSRSELVRFADNPEKWLASKDSGDTDATRWGRLVECLEMQPDTLEQLFAVTPETYPDSKTGAPKPFTKLSNWCKDWCESQGNKSVISPETYFKAQAAVKIAQAYEPRRKLIECSQKQVMVSGEWHDTVTKFKIPVRVLIDLVPLKEHTTMGKWLADFKTSRNGDPAAWARECDDKAYDVQAALYTDLYCAAAGEDRTDWVFPLSENVEPFHVTKPMPAMTSEFLQWGRLKYQSALAYYAQCLATNHWPSYRVFGLPFGPLQLIGPESLWTYRQTAGQGSLTRNDACPPEPQPAETDGITP